MEFLIAVSIVVLLSLFTLGSFYSGSKIKLLEKETEEVVSVLEKARAQAVSSKNSLSYGVWLESGRAVLFSGDVYNPADSKNEEKIISAPAAISAWTLNGGGNSILFKKLSGKTDNYGTIAIQVPGGNPLLKTIKIEATGLVESVN